MLVKFSALHREELAGFNFPCKNFHRNSPTAKKIKKAEPAGAGQPATKGAGQPTSTRTFYVIVENDVNRGTEGVPTSAEPAYPAPESIATTANINAAVAAHQAASDPHPQYLRKIGGTATSVPAVTVTAPAANQTTFNPATATMGNVADMLAQLMIHLKSKQLF